LAPVVVGDAGVADQPLAGHADRRHGDRAVGLPLADPGLGLEAGLAGETGCPSEVDAVVVDQEVDGIGRPADDD
jgi:hypothetical protein